MIMITTRLLMLGLLCLLVTQGGASFSPPIATHAGCLTLGHGISVCAASDMARVTRSGVITLEHSDYDLTRGLTLHAAKNETIAFQLIIHTGSGSAPSSITLDRSNWQPAGTAADSVSATAITQTLYQAHYHYVDKGGYQWGPATDVLPWPAFYPDALIPQQHGCLGNTETLFDSVTVNHDNRQNQSLWLDSYVPPELSAGVYQQSLTLRSGDATLTLPVTLNVHDTTLPHRPSIDAVGEIYRTYHLEGAGYDRSSKEWQRMSWCYQQLAHQHRMVFFERTPELPAARGDYDTTYSPVLDGTLFTDRYGYTGTGQNTPVTVWRTPWPQQYDIQVEAAMPASIKQRYSELARQWQSRVTTNQWNDTRYFAYVFDEVDGPTTFADDQQRRHQYLSMVHNDMDEVQKSIDQGSPEVAIDLLWTSHSNPTQWTDDPALDLRGKVRLWAPNAGAADPAFLSERTAAGDTTWFYHSGHPAIGAHSINNSGIEMRTWGVTGARYGIKGQFMWGVNLGSDERPFAEPSYKPDDDRFGNGVIVYPGNQLPRIGFKATPGPLPSMRLKAWRRGLQDAELFLLAEKHHPARANALIKKMIPTALADAQGVAAWSSNPADWIDFKQALLLLATGKPVSP